MKIVAAIALIWTLRKFLLHALDSAYVSFFSAEVEPRMMDWLKELSISREAMIIYAILAVTAAGGIAVWAILNKKQKDLLRTEAERRGESNL